MLQTAFKSRKSRTKSDLEREINNRNRTILDKSAIDDIDCTLVFCYTFARYSSFKFILIYAKLYSYAP